MNQPRVYLIHFDEVFGTPNGGDPTYVCAGHYIGLCLDGNVERRFYEHVAGRGSKLLAAVVSAGIPIEVVRTWPGSWPTEKKLKKLKKPIRICPVCNPRLKRRRTRKFRLRYEPPREEIYA